MPRATANPLDKYVTSQPSSFPRDFKVPSMPSLRNSLSGRNLVDAAAHLDAQNEQWRKTFEQTISERIRQTQSTNTTTTQVTQVVTAAPASSPSSGVDLSGVNAQISSMQSQIAALFASLAAMATTLGTNNTIPNDGRTYDVPAGYSLIVAGPLEVDGILTVEGIIETWP